MWDSNLCAGLSVGYAHKSGGHVERGFRGVLSPPFSAKFEEIFSVVGGCICGNQNTGTAQRRLLALYTIQATRPPMANGAAQMVAT